MQQSAIVQVEFHISVKYEIYIQQDSYNTVKIHAFALIN